MFPLFERLHHNPVIHQLLNVLQRHIGKERLTFSRIRHIGGDTGVSTDVSDSAEIQLFHTNMSLEDAQELVDDLVMVQALEQRKQLAITL